MVLLITPEKAQKRLAKHASNRRLHMGLTQEGLAQRSGVPLPTLRKFEQKGLISLNAFLKIQMVLGGLDDIVQAAQIQETPFSSIDDVLETPTTRRKRGNRK